MKNQHVDKAKELYLKNLKFANLNNWLLHALFSSFNLMFRVKNRVGKKTFFNSIYTLIDNCELSEEVTGLSFNLSLIDKGENIEFNFRLSNNDIQISHKTFEFNLYNDSISFYDFIQECSTDVIDKFMSLSNKESIDKSNSGTEIASANSFMKKIINIQEVGHMHRYNMVFEDHTQHSVLTPNELTVMPGDYGHLDDHNNFVFIARNGVH